MGIAKRLEALGGRLYVRGISVGTIVLFELASNIGVAMSYADRLSRGTADERVPELIPAPTPAAIGGLATSVAITPTAESSPPPVMTNPRLA